MTNLKKFISISIACTIIIASLISCSSKLGQLVIYKPDEFRHNYEAKETVVLKAIARVFREKYVGANVKINYTKLTVDSDYITQDDWRTKSHASVRKLNWKECEVVLSVIAEKKTEAGWEMRRLLEKEQYDVFFRTIEMKIFEEMSQVE